MDKKFRLEEVARFDFGEDNTNQWMSTNEETFKLDSISKSKKLLGEVNFMEYDPSYIAENSNDFMRVDTKKRLNLLKLHYDEKKKKKTNTEEAAHDLNNQIITINTNYTVSKKKTKFYQNSKANRNVEYNKTKFESIAQIRSEWVELSKIEFDERRNLKIKMETEVLKEETQEGRSFNRDFLKANTKKPIKLKDIKEDIEVPHHIESDEYLMDMFENQKVDSKKTALFVSEYVLYILCNVRKTQFPYILKSRKKDNKFLIYFDILPNNCFTFLESYRESHMNNYNSDELVIQEYSLDSTKIMEAFQLDSINMGSEDKFSRVKNYRYVKISLDADVEIYTKIGLEGVNNKDKEILVRALYDIPSLLLKKNPSSDVFQDCVQHNMARISKWLSQCIFTGTHIYPNPLTIIRHQ